MHGRHCRLVRCTQVFLLHTSRSYLFFASNLPSPWRYIVLWLVSSWCTCKRWSLLDHVMFASWYYMQILKKWRGTLRLLPFSSEKMRMGSSCLVSLMILLASWRYPNFRSEGLCCISELAEAAGSRTLSASHETVPATPKLCHFAIRGIFTEFLSFL